MAILNGLLGVSVSDDGGPSQWVTWNSNVVPPITPEFDSIPITPGMYVGDTYHGNHWHANFKSTATYTLQPVLPANFVNPLIYGRATASWADGSSCTSPEFMIESYTSITAFGRHWNNESIFPGGVQAGSPSSYGGTAYLTGFGKSYATASLEYVTLSIFVSSGFKCGMRIEIVLPKDRYGLGLASNINYGLLNFDTSVSSEYKNNVSHLETDDQGNKTYGTLCSYGNWVVSCRNTGFIYSKIFQVMAADECYVYRILVPQMANVTVGVTPEKTGQTVFAVFNGKKVSGSSSVTVMPSNLTNSLGFFNSSDYMGRAHPPAPTPKEIQDTNNRDKGGRGDRPLGDDDPILDQATDEDEMEGACRYISLRKYPTMGARGSVRTAFKKAYAAAHEVYAVHANATSVYLLWKLPPAELKKLYLDRWNAALTNRVSVVLDVEGDPTVIALMENTQTNKLVVWLQGNDNASVISMRQFDQNKIVIGGSDKAVLVTEAEFTYNIGVKEELAKCLKSGANNVGEHITLRMLNLKKVVDHVLQPNGDLIVFGTTEVLVDNAPTKTNILLHLQSDKLEAHVLQGGNLSNGDVLLQAPSKYKEAPIDTTKESGNPPRTNNSDYTSE